MAVPIPSLLVTTSVLDCGFHDAAKGCGCRSRWPEIEDDAIKSLVPRIGNGVLLSNRIPDSAGAHTFTERRRVFGESNVTLTRELATFETWSESAIDERQRELARRALAVWPRLLIA